MAQDLLATYKYGWKTSYYQNTYDMKSDDLDDVEEVKPQLEKLFTELSEEQECDSCTI
jgi:ribonucleoside-diphosphate reductase alpha chain